MAKIPVKRRVLERIDDELERAATPANTKHRERARAAAAYAWLASLEDQHFQQHRREGVLSKFMFCFLYRLWPLNWNATHLRIDTRRACLVRAAALLIEELQEMERTMPIDYAPEANDPPA